MKKSGIITIAVIITVFLGITLYSGVWPPVSVVSSGSMQHSGSWEPGVITTGDLVYIKKVVSAGSIETYVNGSESGYQSFGEYGNVIIYDYGGHQIIHRAMFYLGWNGSNPIVYGYTGQPWIQINPNNITLKNIGYSGKNLVVELNSIRGMSGFITCGDFNLGNSTLNPAPVADQDQVLGFFDPPVKYGEIVGEAVLDIPWFGLIKLWPMWELHLANQENPAPANSYFYLIVSVAAMGTVLYVTNKIPTREKNKK